MKTLDTQKALILGTLAFAAMLAVQPGYGDEIRKSFERDLNHVPTLSSVPSSVSTEQDPMEVLFDKLVLASSQEDHNGFTESGASETTATATDLSDRLEATPGTASPTPAVNGSDLIGWCEEPVSAYCRGYLLAVADSLSHRRQLCLPENVTARDMGQIYLDWAEVNPALLNGRASVLLDVAYRAAWPCNKG